MATTSSIPDILSGKWQNEWNSMMTISNPTVNPNSISFSGTYATGVWPGGTLPSPNNFPMQGSCDTSVAATGTVALGWVVIWNNGADDVSATSWSGQLMNISSDPSNPFWIIVSTWLLTQETTFENLWTATSVGIDIFVSLNDFGSVVDFAKVRQLLEEKRQSIRSKGR